MQAASLEWKEENRPLRLEKRYEFDSYGDLRDFLDEAADLSEKNGLFPDIGFGKTYANFTIYLEEGSEGPANSQREFAVLLDSLESLKQD